MADRQLSTDADQSEIVRFFDGKSVFITGASGFMGKVLVEKLLWSCPGIQNLYLLIRNKKDVSPDKRLDTLKMSPIFDRVRRSYPNRLNKMVAISGDLMLPELGISQADLKQLADTNVVFHTAATVKFDEALKLSVGMNIWATLRLLQICSLLPNIQSFVHVSTAYCNCDRKKVEERVYPAPANLHQLLAACECLDDQTIDDITKRMIGNRPNTYTFTKAMGEQVIVEHSGKFPIAIFRPSIVTASLASPFPGWVDNLNGPTGIFVGAGKGVLRTVFCLRDMTADLIPVDIAIDTMIAVAWETGIDKSLGIKVYNCTTGLQNPITWGQLEKSTKKLIVKHPFDDVYWYPGGTFKETKYMNNFCTFLYQTIPAYIVDYTTWALGKKTKLSMVRMQNKIKAALEALDYFTTHEWVFCTDNVLELKSRMNEVDRRLFNTDVSTIDWNEYLENYVKGVRKYVLKEDDSNINKAKKHMRKMFLLHYILQFSMIYLFIRAILSRSESARAITYTCVRLSLSLFNKCYQVVTGSS